MPILVTKPFTLSDRRDDSTSVDPGSLGANNSTHSSKPSFNAARDVCRDSKSQSSSRFCRLVSACTRVSRITYAYQRLILSLAQGFSLDMRMDPHSHGVPASSAATAPLTFVVETIVSHHMVRVTSNERRATSEPKTVRQRAESGASRSRLGQKAKKKSCRATQSQ